MGITERATRRDEINEKEQHKDRYEELVEEYNELYEEEEADKSKIRVLWDRYGSVGIGVYMSVYFSTVGLIYGLISQGFLAGEDAITWLKKVHLIGRSLLRRSFLLTK